MKSAGCPYKINEVKVFRFLAYLNVIYRILVPFLIFSYPILSTFLSIITDTIDGDIFQRARVKQKTYQLVDKTLDVYWYIFIIIFSFHGEFGHVLFLLFIFRLVGNLLYYILKDRHIFIFFPNIFEPFFCVYVLSLRISWLHVLLEGENLFITMLIITVLKIINEVIIHGIRVDMTDLLTGKKTQWAG